MKYGLYIIGLIVLTVQAFGQSNTSFKTEFIVAVNRTNLKDNNTDNKCGLGIGANFLGFPDKKINLIVGLEFNRTNQLKKYMYESHFSYFSNLTYSINSITIPLGSRINLGTKIKFFMEAGGYVDVVAYSNRKGTMYTNAPVNFQLVTSEIQINEKLGLSNFIGIYSGIGVRIPFARYELTIKPDYKYGITSFYSNEQVFYNKYVRLVVGIKPKK